MVDYITKEQAGRLARAIFAATHAKTPLEYRDLQSDDMIGIEEMFYKDVVDILAPARVNSRSHSYENELANNELYRRVTGLIKSPYEELTGLDGDDEDEANWLAELAKHETKQAKMRTSHLDDYE